MIAKRQGHCDRFLNDVIDPRDLKFIANVCGYSFRPEDDAFAWRGRIGFARAGLGELLVFSLVLLSAALAFAALGVWHHPAWFAGSGVFGGVWLFILSFFRDPNRTFPIFLSAEWLPAKQALKGFPSVRQPKVQVYQWKGGKLNVVPAGDKKDGWVLGY